MNQLDSAHKGNTGEFFVLAELSRLGWIAAQTPRNARAFDILARKAGSSIAIRVKTKSPRARVFQWGAKDDGSVFIELDQTANDYCILVEVPEREPPTYYIVPTKTINEWLLTDFEKWKAEPGRKGQQRDNQHKRRILHLDGSRDKVAHGYSEKLEPYKGEWELLNKDV